MKNIEIKNISNIKFISILLIANLLIAGIAMLLKSHSSMYFEEGGLFEVLTVLNYVTAMFFYKKNLFTTFSYLPIIIIVFLIDRELGFLRGLMTDNNIIDYKHYIDGFFVLLLLSLLIKDGKKIFSIVIKSFQEKSKTKVKIFAIGFLGIINYFISVYSENNHMRYFEESLEFFVSSLLIMLIITYTSLLKEIKVLKK